MKNFLIYLFLVTFVFCTKSDRIEKLKEQMKNLEKKVAECILENEMASEDLKKRVKESKDGDLRKAFHPTDGKLDRNDRLAITSCRKKFFDKLKEDNKERMNNNNDNL